jgi:hypothetical protein
MVCGSVNGDEESCGEIRDSSLTLRMTKERMLRMTREGILFELPIS